MRSIETTLGLWVSRLMTSDQVKEWAWGEVARLPCPPQELFDLASDGPERCLKRAIHDFPPRPVRLTYVQEFSLRALTTSLGSTEDELRLSEWASRHAMGEDLTHPFVALGYQLDHYLNDCDDQEGARSLLRKELPSLLPQCEALAAPFNDSAA
jgi:hypothetical protein